jgi:hypothetical protein
MVAVRADEWQQGAHPDLYYLIVIYFAALTGIATWSAVNAFRGRHLALFVLIGGQAYWFAIPAMTTLWRDEWVGESARLVVPESGVWGALGGVSTFLIVSAAAYVLVVRWAHRSRSAQEPAATYMTESPLSVDAIDGVLLVLGLLPFLQGGIGIGEILDGIQGSRSGAKPWAMAAFTGNPFVVMGRGAFAAAASLALHRALSVRGKGRLAAALMFAFAFGITYIDSGTRTWTAIMVGPPLLMAFRRHAGSARVRRWLLAAPVVLVGLLWLTQFQKTIRDSGLSAGSIRETEVSLADNDFFAETAVAMSLVPARFDYVGDSAAWLFLTNPIPRAIWPEKPFSKVTLVYGIGRLGNDFTRTGASFMPSVVGQFFMSWGWLGVLEAGLLFGAAYGFIEVTWRRSAHGSWPELIAAAFAILLLVSYRGLYPGFHYGAVILVIVALLRRRLLARKQRRGQVALAGAAPGAVA